MTHKEESVDQTLKMLKLRSSISEDRKAQKAPRIQSVRLQVAAVGKKVAAPKPKKKAESKAKTKASKAIYNFK